MWLPVDPDLPNEVLFGFSLTLITTVILWLIVVDYRRARAARHHTHEWILLSFILMINAIIVSILVYYRRELASFLSSARMITSEPAVLLALLITISYVLFAIYKQDPRSRVQVF
jgi:uncharacterized membrane protein YsdA (DUF1294 family)